MAKIVERTELSPGVTSFRTQIGVVQAEDSLDDRYQTYKKLLSLENDQTHQELFSFENQRTTGTADGETYLIPSVS